MNLSDIYTYLDNPMFTGAPVEPIDLPEEQVAEDPRVNLDFGSPAAPAAASPMMASNPYDPLAFLKDLAVESSRKVDGLTAERDRLNQERDHLDSWAESNWGQLGAAAIGALGGALAGGTSGDIATSAATVGNSYFNNLEAQEKDKKAAAANNINFYETLIKDQTDFGQQAQMSGATILGNLSGDYLKGNIVSTDPNSPYQIDQASEIAKQKAIYSGRLGAADPSTAAAVFGENYNPDKVYTAQEVQQEIQRQRLGVSQDNSETQKLKLQMNQQQLQQAAASLQTGGWLIQNGRVPNKATAPLFANMNVYYQDIRQAIPELMDEINKGSQGDVEKIRSLLGTIQPGIAQMNQAGKALTGTELNVGVLQSMPSMIEADTTTAYGWIKGKLLGVDANKQLGYTLENIEKKMERAGFATGFIRDTPQNRGQGYTIGGVHVDPAGDLIFGSGAPGGGSDAKEKLRALFKARK